MDQRLQPLRRPSPRLLACDGCYLRKVKCDRQENCKTCRENGATCIRSRTGRRRRLKTFQQRTTHSPLWTELDQASAQVEGQQVGSPEIQSRRTAVALNIQPPSNPGEPQDDSVSQVNYNNLPSCGSLSSSNIIPLDSSDRNADAQRVIKVFGTDASLSSQRRHVLESAITLINHYITASQNVIASSSTPAPHACDDALENLPPELFHMLLLNPTGSPNVRCSHWPDHMPLQTLERMSVALLRKTVEGHTALQYQLCVLSKAALFINRSLRMCQGNEMAEVLQDTLQGYIAHGLRILQRTNLVVPSLLNLQALLSAAMLAHLSGDVSQAWTLAAFASRVLVGLGYHTLSNHELINGAISPEVRHCIYWCYYLDTTLSMLLLRPPSLPDLCSDPAELVGTTLSDPLSLEVTLLIRIAEVQHECIPLLSKKKIFDRLEVQRVTDSMRTKMVKVWDQICETRPRWAISPELCLEADAVDFTFYAVFTGVLHLPLTFSRDENTKRDCLHYARKALISLRSIQLRVGQSNRHALDFMFWTVLLNPLTPFFIVFCNVIATSNRADFGLLKDIEQELQRTQQKNPYIANLSSFFTRLVNLCEILTDIALPQQAYQEPGSTTAGPEQWPLSSSSLGEHLPTGQSRDASASNTQSASPPMVPFPHEDVAFVPPPVDVLTCDESLIWELLDIHPSVDWLQTNCLDAMAEFQANQTT